ncbi:MAG: hypothetical protein WCT14_10620 [Treponemataceae bacterium]
MKIIPLVFTSALNLRERALSVQSTWLADFETAYLIGGYHFDTQLRMISLGETVQEDYLSATYKQFFGIKKISELHPEFDWLFITGCDAYVFKDNLEKALGEFDPTKDFFIGGHCGKAELDGKAFFYPSGGPGFALSKALVDKIAPRLEEMAHTWVTTQTAFSTACDLAITYFLKEWYNVSFTYRDGFYHCPPFYYPENEYLDNFGNKVRNEVSNFPIAFHSLSIREMYELHRLKTLKKPSVIDKAFDKIALVLTRKMKTKRIVNVIASLYAMLKHPRRNP